MRTRSAPLRWRRPGWLLLALSLGLIGHTYTSPGGSDEAALRDGSYEDASPPAGLGPELRPLTPSKYIRDFVDSVFRGKADAILDSSEDLRPANLSLANAGFQQYWPGGEWVYTKAELDYCNSTENCNIIFQKYGKVCAFDLRSTIHMTFDSLCELLDANCRDGGLTTWTASNDTKEIKWYPVSKSGVTIKVLAGIQSHVILSPNRNINWRHWVFSLEPNGVYLRDKWNRPTQNNYVSQYEYTMLGSHLVVVHTLEWNGTSAWIRWTIRSPRVKNSNPAFEYSYAFNNFPVRYIGLLGGRSTDPTYWELTGWLAVYRGPCKDGLATVPTEVPSEIKYKLDIDMYNFAERLDEFGYNNTRLYSTTTPTTTLCAGVWLGNFRWCIG